MLFFILRYFLTSPPLPPLPFPPSEQPKKTKFKKNEKNPGYIIILQSVLKIMIICYTDPEIWHMTVVIVIFHFGLLFALLFLEQPKKSKFWKSEKNARRYHHFTHIIINLPKTKQKMLWVVTIAMTRSTLASLWKFQYFRRPVYNPVEHLWWGFYCQNSKQLSIFTKKLHHRCSLRF